MKKTYLLLISLIVINLLLLINLKFTAWPEMLSYPYLRNNGFWLYKDMIHPYPPVLTMALSIVYKIFGYKLVTLKIFTWLIILVNDILIFLIVREVTKKDLLAFFSLAFYIVIQPFLEGNMLWFDLAIVPTILLGILLLLNKKYFLAGLSFGTAILTKQTAVLLIIPAIISIFAIKRKLKPVVFFLLGPILLFLILLVRLITEGAVGGFFNWTLIYPFKYWSSFPGYVQMYLNFKELLILTLLSLPALLLLLKRKFLILIFYFLISLIMVYPRFSFFHLQLGISISAILFGLCLNFLKVKTKIIFLLLIVLFGVLSLPILKTNWQKETRFWGMGERTLAKKIEVLTNPNDRVFLLGLPSNLYVLAQRLPPKLWFDNFGWYLEVPGIQEEILSRWEKAKPTVVITQKPILGNWYDLGTYRPKKITNWLKKEEVNEISLY